MEEKRALVAGASGLVGRNLVDHLLRHGWTVTGLARSQSRESRDAYHHLSVDLLDGAACEAALSRIEAPTNLFYCARLGANDAATEAELNTRMLRNVLEPLRAAPQFRHVTLVHGTKWYGSHLGPYRTPASEDDPRSPGPN